jgi:hypothetical protein
MKAIAAFLVCTGTAFGIASWAAPEGPGPGGDRRPGVSPQVPARAGAGPEQHLPQKLPPSSRPERTDLPRLVPARPAVDIALPPGSDMDNQVADSKEIATLRGTIAKAVGKQIYGSVCVPPNHPGDTVMHVVLDAQTTGSSVSFANPRGLTIMRGAPVAPEILACLQNAIKGGAVPAPDSRGFPQFSGTIGVQIGLKCNF